MDNAHLPDVSDNIAALINPADIDKQIQDCIAFCSQPRVKDRFVFNEDFMQRAYLHIDASLRYLYNDGDERDYRLRLFFLDLRDQVDAILRVICYWQAMETPFESAVTNVCELVTVLVTKLRRLLVDERYQKLHAAYTC